ncbi:cell division protein ZapE [Bartonella sp. B10834G6]|uniref:cell division protein ZapE n=1 Tax=Bartonella apis TaxID=1686310 RepID=UPI0018DDFA93|nr:cell division protein ZapE [Bartonella apis]MBH9981419.1 cell division protein ZapE [Bartonella apis]
MGAMRERYDALVENGEIDRDEAQITLISHFDRLLDELAAKRMSQKSSPLGWLFGKHRDNRTGVRGLYVYGEVGRGKTMLMDLFFSCLPDGDKRRAHFNDFMADVHDRINRHRQALTRGETKQNDPIPPVAASLAKEAKVLCFDEFTVTDIADAMVLSRLFTALFKEGVTLISTSNVAPDNLYKNGLNRQLFLPFIKILEDNVEVFNLDADTDYRLEKADRKPVYITPLSHIAQEKMDAAWALVEQGNTAKPDVVEVRGHPVQVPRAVNNAARFDYIDLCSIPLAAADYLALSDRYHTFFIDNVPIMDDEHRNETKRFILLIDTLYDRHIRLFISAAATPDKLYQGTNQTTETFEFERTSSRLFEMQSEEYLANWNEKQVK